MIVNIIDAYHNDTTVSIATLPYITPHLSNILKMFRITHEVHQTIAYHDPISAQLFVIHPKTHQRLWIAEFLALQLQGFSRLIEEVPRFEPAPVVETSDDEK